MSYISRALRSNDGHNRLVKCKSAEEMRKFFREVK
jgi:hypothetical protein